MKQIINSILDTDIYKFSMQYFVIQHYSDVDCEYEFKNRDLSMKFTEESVAEIRRQINLMQYLKLTNDEYDYLKTIQYLPISYRQYLAAYRFNPNQVKINLTKDNELKIHIVGKWRDSILWEVPLMSIISEVYFTIIDTDWSINKQSEIINEKAKKLCINGCMFADFGTRRRRSFDTQEIVVRESCKYSNFVGTSNPYLAMKYGLTACGTCAHEAISGVAALDSLNHPNRVFMQKWSELFNGSLGIMLPDTFGLKTFLKDFDLKNAKLWDGLRHDSGDPYEFIDKVIEHYKKLKIDPLSKTIVFSNALNVDTAIDIKEYCDNKIKCSFGIGTHLTSDFNKIIDGTKSKPMNMVIKLVKVNNCDCVKLSDDIGKAIGDPKMIEIMKYIHC